MTRNYAVYAPGDPSSLTCKGFGSKWSATGRCQRCGRHWTDILQTYDRRRDPFATGLMNVPAHKERGALRK